MTEFPFETGTTDRFAKYVSGSGTSTLTFNYTVEPGDTTLDLDYLTTIALTLEGGTIKDSTGMDADLTLPALASAESLSGSKAFAIDTSVPTLNAVTSTTPDGNYLLSGNLGVNGLS